MSTGSSTVAARVILACVVTLALGGAATPAHAVTYTVLHSFAGPPTTTDGAEPYAELLMDGSGNLYGTTYAGGTFFTLGTVYKLDTSGTLTVLHSFAGPPTTGGF